MPKADPSKPRCSVPLWNGPSHRDGHTGCSFPAVRTARQGTVRLCARHLRYLERNHVVSDFGGGFCVVLSELDPLPEPPTKPAKRARKPG